MPNCPSSNVQKQKKKVKLAINSSGFPKHKYFPLWEELRSSSLTEYSYLEETAPKATQEDRFQDTVDLSNKKL